jgi:hypothetical protein
LSETEDATVASLEASAKYDLPAICNPIETPLIRRVPTTFSNAAVKTAWSAKRRKSEIFSTLTSLEILMTVVASQFRTFGIWQNVNALRERLQIFAFEDVLRG